MLYRAILVYSITGDDAYTNLILRMYVYICISMYTIHIYRIRMRN